LDPERFPVSYPRERFLATRESRGRRVRDLAAREATRQRCELAARHSFDGHHRDGRRHRFLAVS
ncbi:unnamed protein product, partial [Urochloa humidicola]